MPHLADDLDGAPIVAGVIAENPFFRCKSLPVEFRDSDFSIADDLRSVEVFLCALTDWHDDGDVINRYFLHGVEVGSGSRVQMIRPFGTWDRVVRRARPHNRDGLVNMLRRCAET